MNNQWFYSILLLSVIGSVYGRLVSFNVIAFGGQASVTVGGKSYPMNRVDNYSSLHTATIECSEDPINYKYSIDASEEPFNRVLPVKVLTTHNEFFGRPETLSPMLGLGYPQEKPQWTHSIGKTALFDDSYIPTVIVDAGSRDFFISGNDTWTLGRFTIILQDEVFTDENVPTKAQNRYQDKFQWRVRLSNKIHKRKVFKFRANPADPTFYRQSLYGDLAAAVGNPVHNQIIVRVYLDDGTPIGLYLMIEVTSSNSFIKTQFYGNEIEEEVDVPKTGLGSPLDCSTGADFIPGSTFRSFQPAEGHSNEKIKYLTDAMHALDVNDPEAVSQFNKVWFDLDIFFKFLALEYLTGDWDSYWMYTTNFVMYDAPEESTETTFKYYFIDQDYDLTFGIGLSPKINLYGHDFPSQSYKTLVDRTWNIEDDDGPNREAIDLFLRGGYTKEMFENHLVDIVKYLFNPVSLGRRLDEYVRRYSDEVAWDYSLERLHIGGDPSKPRYVWTLTDYYENLDSTPKENVEWGLKEWIKMRAKAVTEEFGFKWEPVPIDPSPRVITVNNAYVLNLTENPNYNFVNNASSYNTMSILRIFITIASTIFVFFF